MNKSKTARILTVTVLALCVAFTAVAESEFGNPEEPALRPYKGLWRGIKAFTFNVVRSIDYGNRKFPGLGMVEIGRGVRYGAIELASSTYTGMMGSRPRPTRDYGRLNEFIDSDMLLRNAANLAGGAVIWKPIGGDSASEIVAAAGVFTAQKVVDNSPVLSEREARLYLQEVPRYTAQREYLGRRAVPRRTNGDINFVRRARQQRVVEPAPPPAIPLPPGTGEIPPPLEPATIEPGMPVPLPPYTPAEPAP